MQWVRGPCLSTHTCSSSGNPNHVRTGQDQSPWVIAKPPLLIATAIEPRTLSDNTRIPLRVPRMEAKSGDALTCGFRHIVYPIGS